MREKFAIFLISSSLIGFQLAIINILSYSQWHHFAYLAVSIAMLGFGSSGVILSIKPHFFNKIAEKLLPWLFILSGVIIVASPFLISTESLQFDTFLVFTSNKHIIKFAFTCIILFIPFFTGATIVGVYFMIRSNEIPVVYSWNLAGSAIGGIILIVLSNFTFPNHLALLFGMISIFSALLVCKTIVQRFIAICLLVICIPFYSIISNLPSPSQFKSISKTLLLPDTKKIESNPGLQGVTELLESSNIRQAQGMSLNYLGEFPKANMAFVNGDSYFGFLKGNLDSMLFIQNLYALPYTVKPQRKVLLLQPGSTFFASQALFYNSDSVTVIESNRSIYNILCEYNWTKERVHISNEYPRLYLSQTTSKWDYIQFPIIGSFGGSSGVSAMQEQFLFTNNSLQSAMGSLTREGIISLSTYMDSPPRYSLRIISLAIQTLRTSGIDIRNSLVALRNWNTILVLVKPSGFLEKNLFSVILFCQENGFDMVYPKSNEMESNTLSDSLFNQMIDLIINSETEIPNNQYAFNIKSPDDNNPFFSQFLKISRLMDYRNWIGNGLPFVELGYLIVWLCLAFCAFLAFITILFPVVLSLKRGNQNISLWLYFALIGLGYMMIEISLIQKSILVVGSPYLASALVVSSLLCFSAIGSNFSNRLIFGKNIRYVLGGIGVTILLVVFFNQYIFSVFNCLTIWLRAFALSIFICPLAFLMGIPFPLAMKKISSSNSQQIPVVWGINGFFSVIAAPIGTILAVEYGFNQVLVLSAMFYLLCIPLSLIGKSNN